MWDAHEKNQICTYWMNAFSCFFQHVQHKRLTTLVWFPWCQQHLLPLQSSDCDEPVDCKVRHSLLVPLFFLLFLIILFGLCESFAQQVHQHHLSGSVAAMFFIFPYYLWTTWEKMWDGWRVTTETFALNGSNCSVVWKRLSLMIRS